MKNRLTAKFTIFVILLSAINLLNISVSERAFAATVGSGNCVQTVDNALDVQVTSSSGYCYVAFKSGTRVWTPPSGVSMIDILVVGGGGGGASRHAGGGGAGGLLQSTNLLINGTDLTISVGSGGAGGAAQSAGGANANSGETSTVTGGGITTLNAIGGGGGAYGGSPGSSGGSGGGGGSSGTGGTGTVGQGNNGSAGKTNATNYWVGGGGGGAGGVGTASSATKGGSGGGGLEISWIPTSVGQTLTVGVAGVAGRFFAGGGGGGTDRSDIGGGDGGDGGGGAGATYTANANAGTVNTGGGGGGSGISGVGTGSKKGGDGGSGVALIRYTIPVSVFSATNYTAGSTTWANSITGATAGTAPTGGMTKTSSEPTGVVFAGKESSNSDQISSSIGSTTSLDTVTVEMWLKLKDSGSAQNAAGSMIFSWSAAPSTVNYNVYHVGDQIGFNNFGNQVYGLSSSSYNNNWTHFVFVMTDTGPWSSQKIYINGTLQTSVACKDVSGNIVSRCELANTRSFNSSGDFLLMGNTYSQHNWNAKGDLGLVRIYNQELSAASVLSLYDSTSPDFTEASDTTAPTFTSSSTFSAAENIATSATAATIRVSESATVTISSGADAARFNITRSETNTAIIKFNVSPDFEAPIDVGANNVYEITLTATDAAANAGTQSITITVTDVVDTSSFTSLALAGSATTATFRSSIVITANVSVASKVTFRARNIIISGCKNKLTSGSSPNIIATCSWKPSMRGSVVITASAVPTGAGISTATATPVSVVVGNRSGAR